MSGQALQLQAELTSLAQEAKRKNPEIRTVAKTCIRRSINAWLIGRLRPPRDRYKSSNLFLLPPSNNSQLVRWPDSIQRPLELIQKET